MSQDAADKPTASPSNETEAATSSPPPPADTKTEPNGEETASSADDGAEAPSEAPPEPEVPSLEEQLAASKDATAKMKEKMLRIAADFENFRRRSSREVEDSRQRGTQGAIKDLLPVFDNLERATAHVDDSTSVESMVKGLEMVHKQFLDVLGKIGIERVPAVGEGFDPNVHESIQYEHSDEHAAGVVMTELQPGYRMGKMLLRPALVVVSRGPAAAETDASGDESTDAASEGGASEGDEAADETPPGVEGAAEGADDAEQSGQDG